MKKRSSRFHLSYRFIASLLIILHLATFSSLHEALAFSASSSSYRLDTGSPNSGGNNRSSSSLSIDQDTIGEPCAGKVQSASYSLNAGYIPTLQSDPPKQTQIIPNQAWNLNLPRQNAFNLDDYFSGNGALTYSYSFIGSHNISVAIDPSTHQVSFSQTANWYGTEKVKFTAADSSYSTTSSNEVALQVIGPSNAPVLDYIPDITANEGELVKVIPHATDADGNTITYTFTTPLNSQGEWQTDFSKAGIYSITVTATDSSGLKDTRSFCLIVKDVNRAPIVEPIEPITVNEGQTVLITPHATDPDGNALYYYFTEPLDSTGKWLTGYDDAGTRTLYMFVTDGIVSASMPIQVSVLNLNRPPQARLMISKNTLNPSESFNIAVDAFDLDGDALTLVVKKNDEVLYSGPAAAKYSFNTSIAVPGDYVISATVTDPSGLLAQVQQDIDVVDTGINRDLINPVMGDFNGDALTDLGLHNSQTGEWEVCLSEKGVFKAARRWKTGFGTSSEWWPISGDYNGDGKTDIGIYNISTGELQIALSGGSTFSGSGTWFTFPGASYSWQPFSGNFNGDKYADIGFYNKDTGEIKAALGTGSGFSPATAWYAFGTDYTALSGDFNGDGLSDFCLFKRSSGEFKVAFSNTYSFVDGTSWISGFATDKDPLISDFNNDGLADIGYWDKSTSRWYYAISSGSTFADKGVWLDGFGQSTDESATTGDFDGNGITDAACFDKDQIGINRWTTRLSTNKPADLLIGIDNGIGGKTEVVYTYAAENDNSNLPFPVYVASSISLVNIFPADRSASYTQDFTFSGGYYDAAEREFRGFAKVKVTDPITNNYSETYFYQGRSGQDGALKGQIEKVAAYDGKSRQISQSINTYEVKKSGPQNNGLGFPSLKEQSTTVWEENGTYLTTKSKFTYDDLGNLLKEESDGDISKSGDEKCADTTYSPAYEAGFNRPLEALLKDKDGNLVSKKNFAYDNRGNLIEETAWLNTQDTQPKASYGYDSFGNVVSSTNSLGSMVTTEYETDFYTYPKKVINSLGHFILYTYEPKFGVVKSTTDANGSTSSTTYDSLGRPLEVTNANNQVDIIYSYPDFNTKITTNVVGLSKTEYIDGLGRKYKAVSNGEDGALERDISSEVFYNQRGQKYKESLAHYDDEEPGQISYVRYEYDLRGRIKKTISDFPGSSADAQASVNFVNPLYAEVTDALGRKKDTLKDVYGNILEVTDFTSDGVYKTKYAYDLQGNLIKTTDNQGNIIQVFYDSLGRKTKMIDPDMGTWNYEYDLVGSLKRQTDAKGQILEFNYDSINRLTDKSANSLTLVRYFYDDSLKDNCVGRLSKVTDQSGSTEFFYDKLGREIKSIKTIDATTYIVERTYDTADRLSTLKYPDEETLTYTYDANSGLLEKVQGASAYVQDMAYNAKGQLKTLRYGNNVQTVYTYGQDLRLSRILTQGTTNFQDLNYAFDKNGNLLSLTDNLRSNTRTYNYDDLGRLAQAHNLPSPTGGYTDFYYQYDSIGNMIYKSDTGTMTYGQNAGPHAVTSAGGYFYQYDANGNMIQGKNKTLTYDAENRLMQVSATGIITSFLYDGDGGRVKKTIGSDSSIYIGSLFEKDSSGKTTKHIFAGSNRVASVESTGNTYYYHSDHLGSSNIITNQSGQQVQYCEYTPYGSLAKNEGEDAVKYKFTGKELDSTGLYFYGARYYDPEIGRFITPDTIVQAPYDPQSLNRYSYCRNNPINYVDPSGHFFWFAALIFVAACAAVGAVANVAIAGATGQLTSWTAFWAAMGSGAVAGAISGVGAFVPGAGTVLGGILIGAVAGGAAGAVGSEISGAFSWGSVGLGAAYGGALGGFGNSSAGRALGRGVGKAIGKLPYGQHIQNLGQAFGNKMGQLYQAARGTNSSVGNALTVNKGTEDAIDLGKIEVKRGVYPPNRGFLGEPEDATLQPGTIVDRYGDPNGRFVAPQGTPPAARSLPPGSEVTSLYSYEVVKPLGVRAGPAAPWFNQPGLGTQYELPYTTQQLVDQGYLRPTDN